MMFFSDQKQSRIYRMPGQTSESLKEFAESKKDP